MTKLCSRYFHSDEAYEALSELDYIHHDLQQIATKLSQLAMHVNDDVFRAILNEASDDIQANFLCLSDSTTALTQYVQGNLK